MTRMVDMIVPPTGEALDAARLVAWIVKPGQAFKAGDVLVEIETDKSIIEVPAEEDGLMVEHVVAIDGLVNADTVIAKVQVESEAPAAEASGDGAQPAASTQPGVASVAAAASAAADAAAGATATSVVAVAANAAAAPATTMHAQSPASQSQIHAASSAGPGARKLATPAARRTAAERGISLDAVRGTGPNGRVTVADVGQARPQARDGGQGVREAWAPTRHGEVRVSLWENGAGPGGQTVVLVHGMFGDRDAWASLAHALSRAGMRVLAMDLPCHGQTRSQATRFEDVVDTVADAIGSECAGPVTLVGHSFGAAVAARAASRPGIGAERLILIAPVGLGTEIEQSFLTGMTHAGTDEAVQRELAKLTVSGMTPSASFIGALRQSTQARRDALIELCRSVGWNGVQQVHIGADLASAPCRSTIIHGRRDAIIPWTHSLNAPPRTALHLLPDAGHMPQWEAGKLVTEIVLDAVPA